MKVIGVTGGVGSGKSTVLQHLKNKLRCRIILADEIAHDVKKRGKACYKALIDLLGSDILDDDLEINKAKMSQKIFSNDTFLEKVNAIIHPAVLEEILAIIRTEKDSLEIDYLFIEAALLIEAGYRPFLDELWVIYVNEDTRIHRLSINRGYSREKSLSIIENQLSDEGYRSNADKVFDNSNQVLDTIKDIINYLKMSERGKVT